MSLSGAVGELGNPKAWPQVSLRRVLTQSKLADFPNLPLLGVSLHTGVTRRLDSDGRPAPSDDLTSYKLVEPDDVIMNRLGKPHGSVGVSPWQGITSPAYWVMPVDRTIADPRFMHHLLRSKHMIAEYERLGKNQPPNQFDISWESFREIEVPLAPLEEQRRIADFLDAETSRIDRIVDLRRLQVSTLNERYNTAISELVTPGIASSSERSSKWPWLPANVSVVRLGYLARVQSGVTVHGARVVTDDDQEFPYLRVANVQGERVDLSEIKTIRIPRTMARSAMLYAGDVVMTEANGNPDNLGRGAMWDGQIEGMVHQNHVFAIRVDRARLLPEFLTALLASSHGRRYFRFTSTQVGIATTSSSKVLDFPIPALSLAKQQKIVDTYARMRDIQLRAVDVLGAELELLSERRRALITAAVTGQFDVSTASGSNTIQGV
ncbi:hypothetical protein [Nocardia sp. A7]|uniref:hypothetical protein n=1 Tax=Nocardia sp. A7 TaxID=2789274 RepID=UPI00397B80B0